MAENLSDQEEDYAALRILQNGNDSESLFYEEEDAAVTVSQNSVEEVTVVSVQEEEEDQEEEDDREKRRRNEGNGEMCCSVGYESSQGGSQWNRAEIDGLFCPICMEAWTSEGDHHICCLSCGHLFGLSCISKWIRQRGRSARCPQCNSKCIKKDVRKLFVPTIAVFDEESQKRIRFLEAKCASLEKKGAEWLKERSERKKREAELQLEVNKLEKKTNDLQHLLGKLQSRPLGALPAGSRQQGKSLYGNNENLYICNLGSSSSFGSKTEMQVEGARLFDVVTSAKMLLIARKLPGMGGSHVLTKMSLMSPHESEDIHLPSNTKFIKDMHISPWNGDLALCASLGKKLSVLSLQSNNIVLSYDLPAPAWSCSWDLGSSHYVCAGLQNGSLLLFDMRQTNRPLESRLGLSTNPIHTVYSLVQEEPSHGCARPFLSGSSVGICEWNFGSAEERPLLITGTENHGVCISLAYCGINNDIVASYRPKVEMSNEMAASQPFLTPSLVSGHGTSGLHIHLKRVGINYKKLGTAAATVSDIRLPKSVIINRENQDSLFASGDEGTHQLVLQELPSFAVAQSFKSHNHFICDVKYLNAYGQGLLGCLSEDTVQLFCSKHSLEG